MKSPLYSIYKSKHWFVLLLICGGIIWFLLLYFLLFVLDASCILWCVGGILIAILFTALFRISLDKTPKEDRLYNKAFKYKLMRLVEKAITKGFTIIPPITVLILHILSYLLPVLAYALLHMVIVLSVIKLQDSVFYLSETQGIALIVLSLSVILILLLAAHKRIGKILCHYIRGFTMKAKKETEEKLCSFIAKNSLKFVVIGISFTYLLILTGIQVADLCQISSTIKYVILETSQEAFNILVAILALISVTVPGGKIADFLPLYHQYIGEELGFDKEQSVAGTE